MTGWSLRPGRAADAAILVGIERRACGLLRGHEAYPVFARSTLAADDHVEAAARGRLWVAESGGHAVGYALYSCVDGEAYLVQMDVDPDHGRRGMGRALLERACASAAGEGFGRITLVTLRDVPWNAPFYASAGFEVLEPARYTPGLRATLAEEHGLGFPMRLRVVMQRRLGQPG